MLTKMTVTDDQLARLVSPLGEIAAAAPLDGGLFASTFRVDLTDGRRVVVKITSADTSRLLRYEHGILGTEETVYRLVADRPDLLMPRVVHSDFSRSVLDGDALVVTFLDGAVWNTLPPLDDDATARVHHDLGAFMARLHTVTGDTFGYPAPASGMSAATWPQAFGLMVEALLADAGTWGVDLPVEALRAVVARHHDALAEVTVPRLVHADLWPGNLFLSDATSGSLDAPSPPRLSGVIDTERCLWADPLYELAGADQLGLGPVPPALAAGYRAAGGHLPVDEPWFAAPTPGEFRPDGVAPDGSDAVGRVRPGASTLGAGDVRLLLYRAYISAVLVTEVVPRDYQGEWVQGYRDTAAANLDVLLDQLSR
ncbi:phosphotransferase family protein [Oerskovia jenensis]|uniref:Fructosamine-3-kinase n=1 Tax=Oerskovia jenensis TaxID=162169 RepID=A0ABS2LF53_9CELL|nr:aminoglycoside phosphotransferase family protein [Oerskovia jenensis]MBM7479007.1 fructosamine-3-kinase [Oerskovia jenensis]